MNNQGAKDFTGEIYSNGHATKLEDPGEKWRDLSSNRKYNNDYETMLLNSLPGSSMKTNTAMHAVLESELEEDAESGERARKQRTPIKVRNHALLHYFANLANSNDPSDTMDYDFVESLIKNGASINTADKHGQTVFHEVSRSWHTDVAKFLIDHGADVNQSDKFGRSPLHVASAVDYSEMVEFLIQNGCDHTVATKGENQCPLHYAAKNDAINSIRMLLAYGADINARDHKNRTPLQVAAELNRSKSVKVLMEEGAPAAVHDNEGTSAISMVIQKMPLIATEALEQLHVKDRTNRKQYYYLSCLNGLNDENIYCNLTSYTRNPLEVAVHHKQFELIMHPVFQRLINVKWEQFGKIGAWLDLVLNTVYAILWTILGVTLPQHPNERYTPLSGMWWRVTLEVCILLLTIYETRNLLSHTWKSRHDHHKWVAWRRRELEKDLCYCHPQWPEERRYLEQEIKSLDEDTPLIFHDSWNYLEWITCAMLAATVSTHAIDYFAHTNTTFVVHIRITAALLIVLWLRIIKYARPFKTTGPFVVMLVHMVWDILKWLFLFLVFYVPYSAAFWMIFGAISPIPVRGYTNVSDLFYQLFRMTVVDEYNFEGLQAADSFMARFLCATYITFSHVIILNLLIALLSDTFYRVYENARANSVMQRAYTILTLERNLSKKRRRKMFDFIRTNCSPEVLHYEDDVIDEVSQTRVLRQILDDLNEMKKILTERLSKKIGKGSKSDLDIILGNMAEVMLLQSKHEQTLATIQTELVLLSNLMDTYIANGRTRKTTSLKRGKKSRDGKASLVKSTLSTAPMTAVTSQPVKAKKSKWANVAKLSSQIKARAAGLTALGMGPSTAAQTK
ncbi:transient receptor potential cation channel subfamily A member 1 homolog [Dendronephthya gigantea]|uniref:transient receptor potential cation channel subfamily A member 1 homolog n=1 Tax=Dendronephthya gigantea TaxID=151771 RepID=UPI0010699E45|nr:transient receptor potential cation channel subfamily A member 1 homolog [Dendronephthya gigantea]